MDISKEIKDNYYSVGEIVKITKNIEVQFIIGLRMV